MDWRLGYGLVPILQQLLVDSLALGWLRKVVRVMRNHAQSMVTGLTGRTGATVLSRVGEECRKEQGLVPIPHRHLEESRVLGRVKKRERAMKTPAQLTETGPTGMTGATAPSRVVAECRRDQELVPILRHNLEETRVPGKVSRPVLVMKSLVQLMVTGLTGRTGATALLRVAAECRIDQERAPIPRQLLVESRVLERVTKPERAMKIPARLMATGQNGRTGATVPSRVVAESKIGLELVPIPRRLLVESRALERVTKAELATKILAQSTETGLTGMTGVTVLSRVVAECKKDQGPVPILRRRLVESHALGRAGNQESAMKTLAQLMVTGLSGKTGATVPSRVAAVCRIGQGLVPTPLRHLEESRVRVVLTKHVRVTNSLAQGMATGRTGNYGAPVLLHVVEECSNDQEPVPILRRRLVARRVQEKARKLDPVTKIPAQSTETGQTGVRGGNVQSHVVGELSSILAVVIIRLLPMED